MKKISKPLILLGLSRSGKTSVGIILAKQLHLPFYDTDALIQEKTAMRPRQLYREKGKNYFYTYEYEALVRCLTDPPNSNIIATGGGVCDNPKAAMLIEQRDNTFFLHTDEATLFMRMYNEAKINGNYPAFLDSLPFAKTEEAKKRFSILYGRRTAWYRHASSYTIVTKGLYCADIAKAIMEKLYSVSRH